MYDVVVIGGRVAGARTAELLAKKGADVLIVDGRKTVSDPVQCTGFVSHRFLKLLPDFPKKYQYNQISKAKFYSPGKKTFTLNSKPFTVMSFSSERPTPIKYNITRFAEYPYIKLYSAR